MVLIKTHWYTNILFKNQVTNSEEAFIYGKRHRIDKSLFNEVSSSISLGSPIDWQEKLVRLINSFRKTNAFSDVRFEDKNNNLWNHICEEFLWDGSI